MKTNSYYNLMDVKEAVGVAESTKGNKGKAFLQVNDAIFL